MSEFGGIPVIASALLPTYPSHREDARRIVRHGMADVLDWLGEKVGPKPGEPTHAYMAADYTNPVGAVLITSREWLDRLSDAAQDAQDGAVGPGGVRMGRGEGAAPNGAQIEDFEGER